LNAVYRYHTSWYIMLLNYLISSSNGTDVFDAFYMHTIICNSDSDCSDEL